MRRNYIETVLLIALGSYWCIFFLIKFDFLLSEYFDAFFFWFQANLTEVEINIDPKHHRHFFSRRNEVTNKISLECGGVEIVFPRATSKSSLVVLKGSKQCVETAKSRIEAILADLVFQILSIYWNCSSLVYFCRISTFHLLEFQVHPCVVLVDGRVPSLLPLCQLSLANKFLYRFCNKIYMCFLEESLKENVRICDRRMATLSMHQKLIEN